MKVVEGQIPQGSAWRVLVALTPGQPLDITWRLGRALAEANRGELVLAYVVPDGEVASLTPALEGIAYARSMPQEENGVPFHPLILEATDFPMAVSKLVVSADIDLALLTVDHANVHDFGKVPCAVGVTRNVAPDQAEFRSDEELVLDNILVPTSGGPNSAYALGLLLPLAPEVKITALYVASERYGENSEGLGHARLRQTLDFVEAGDKIESKLVAYESVTDGIISETDDSCDLIVIGASEESRIDQILFGNIPETVIAQVKRPVMVLRRGGSRVGSFINKMDWRLQSIIPRKQVSERVEIYARIRRGARPETYFYVLMALSSIIAALGLIVDSPAVVIGAMLVAPLMSPIIGTGLAIVMGDTRFLRLTVGAVNRGVLVAIGVSVLVGLLVINRPFSNEIISRTQPTLFDLGIAVFSGMAAAYALSFSQAAGALPGVAIAAALVPPLATVGITLAAGLGMLVLGNTELGWSHLQDSLGALLLFTTNYIAISSAAALVFFILGFRPTASQKARREVQKQSARVAIILLALVGLVLGGTSYLLARQSSREAQIQSIVAEQTMEVTGAQVVESQITSLDGGQLTLVLVVRSPRPLSFFEVRDLQESIAEELLAAGLATELAMTMSVIEVTELDPLVPPTPTPTPLPTNTATPGPTPTPTVTPTPLPTNTATPLPTNTAEPTPLPTETALPTATIMPTATTIPTATPRLGRVLTRFGVNLRAAPSSLAPLVAFLPSDTELVLLDGRLSAEGLEWQEVTIGGLSGWVSALALEQP